MPIDGTINAPGGGFTLGGYRELRVPAELRPLVEVAWVFEASARGGAGGAERHRILPETGVSLCVVRCGHQAEADPRRAELFLMGPIRTPRVFVHEPGMRIEGLRLKPEWCKGLLGIDPEEHVDGFEPAPGALGSLVGGVGAGRPGSRLDGIGLLARALGSRWELHRRDREVLLAHQALEAMRASPTDPSACGARADTLGVSARHLRRLVRAFTGYGMKAFHRVRRLQHAASLATEPGNPHWARLALGAGYSDQAHLIREFRALAGVTPVELREERLALDVVEAGRP